MVGCAAITIYGCDQYHFFNGNTYARIDWAPGQSDVLIHGPSLIINDWKSLRDAGFSQIDAILPLDQVYKAFVFSGPRFCRIRYLVGQGDDALLTGVSSITEHWRSLAKAGFDHVDGAMVVPGATNQAYFFSGSKVCRVAFNTTDELLEGPYEINKRWYKLGFQTIDTVFQAPILALKRLPTHICSLELRRRM
ncbi:hypothetical protein FRC12_000949 [Ceratobasidium sp. 428]|nr:hypothetical protein FRC09_012709 [Ceratobasidium sp. 395]KAG8793985.1 hypothetical protein FRC12_000949 [Ceratobasidium sp. 428]